MPASRDKPVRVLMVEDSREDGELIERALLRDGLVVEALRVETGEAMRDALRDADWDIIIVDFNLPRFDAYAALEVRAEFDPDLPVIVVSGSVGEDSAVGAMRAGAADYVMKDRLSRLAPAVLREVRDAGHRRGHRRSAADLRLLDRAMEAATVGISIGDASRPGFPLMRVNPAFTRITGYAESEVLGKRCDFLQGRATSEQALSEMREALADGAGYRGVLLNYRKDGSAFWNNLTLSPVRDEAGRVTHYAGIQVDITAQKKAEAQLAWVTSHDALTGLPNRAMLAELLGRAVSDASAHGRVTGIIFLDLDRFALVNESFGRPAGDQVLLELVERFKQCLRPRDFIARTGPDEFVVVAAMLRRKDDLTRVADKLAAAIADPFEIEQTAQPVTLTASLGLALYPDDGSDHESLLKNAESAMLRVKESGRNNYQFYSVDMTRRTRTRLSTEAELRMAIRKEEFTLHFQPLFDVVEQKVVGAEALVRWNHPVRGLVGPGEFIPLAEESDLIVGIGEWVMHAATAQLGAWRKRGHTGLRIAVNLSQRQLQPGYLPGLVDDALKRSGLPPQALELELTETLLMRNMDDNAAVLQQIGESGVSVAIDDFGTGYSSLAYLKLLPVHALKIDMSFIQDIGRDADSERIINAIVALAHGMGMNVVGEGIESEVQLRYLERLGCNVVQGFHLGRPVPAEEFGGMLDTVS